jgi:MFS transporter, DHA1 family, solute carrier family 18 (vesicular amine transporter), member 1/2
VRSSRHVAVAFVTLGAFTDLVAYSIAVPVLPDLTRRLGASPIVIGLLFASFGVTLLGVSVPIGAISDRIGRRAPLVLGMVALALATLAFAYGDRLPWLFSARLMQGAADAVTWGVGFALVADLYGPTERGRVMGLVMAGSNLGFMIGPSLGGWLYESGGARLPFLVVTGLALAAAAGFLWLRLPRPQAQHERVPLGTLVRSPAVVSCAITVVVAAATISMLEPVLSLWMSSTLGLQPGRIGLVFGVAAVASTALHPVYGRLSDRYGGRRLMLIGLGAAGVVMPLLGLAGSYGAVVAVFIVLASTISLVVTPSLTYMANATGQAGASSFGVSFGLYNFAWGAGLMAGPAIGGVLYETIGFGRLLVVWSPVVLVTALLLAHFGSERVPDRPL